MTGRLLGWEAVRDVVGGTAIYSELYPMVQFRKIGLTNQGFNDRAHERARANGVRLIEYAGLGKLISRYPIGTLDVRAMLNSPRI